MESLVTHRFWRWHGWESSQRHRPSTQGVVGRLSKGTTPGCFSFPSLSFASFAASPSSSSSSSPFDEPHPTPFLEDLLIPASWTSADAAAQEAEWLRVALHQWLDDEYCPEPANNEISRRCSRVYYYCLMEKQRDMGDILMQMVRDLETFSFKESFHGTFSSANAAVDLITKKIRRLEGTN